MLQDKLDQQQQLKNYGRRSRKDQQGRDYVCGCGKSYLSYPALYTHIKTKHDGLRPEGTFKIGLTVSNKKANSTPPSNTNTHNINTHNTPSNQSIKSQTPIQIKSKISSSILKALEDLVKEEDLHILKELNEQALGFTHPDLRIKKSQTGEVIFQKYNILLKQSESELADEEILNSFINLSNKSALDTVLVSYLIAVGKYVSQNMMQYYAKFANMFYECYYDHGEQIYQVCYKNNEHYCHETKQRQKQREKQRQRDRDNPQKCYQYSYPPSSSKSKSYNNFISSTHAHAYNNIQINIKECKYSPIICEFFIRCFVPAENDLQYYKSMMELITNDFCSWMFKKKLTVVEVGFNKKYEVYRKDMINIRDRAINTYVDYPKNSPSNVQVDQQVSIKVSTSAEHKQKSKRKQRQKITRIPSNNSGNKNKTSKYAPPSKINAKPPRGYEKQQNYYNNEFDNSQGNQMNGNEEQSYKIGHEIGHESVGLQRDRSGSINVYINGHTFGEGDHDHDNEHVQGNIVQNGGNLGHGSTLGGRNAENSVNEEEIQQYFSVHKI